MESARSEARMRDPWAALNRRRREDSFALFVEQIEQIAGLLAAGTVGKERMALVALDNLAEVLLYRHTQGVFEADGSAGWMYERRYSRKDHRRVADEFSQKVNLAQQESHLPSWRALNPILDAADGAVFLTAHAYRNRVYHEGRHNASLLPILTRAYMAAIVRTFVRSSPVNVGYSSYPISKETLRRYGYEPEGGSWGSMFVPGHAAQAIGDYFKSIYDVDFDSASRVLSEDLVERASGASEMLAWLASNGMDEERLRWSIRWADFLDQHGADDELVRLDGERMRLYREVIDGNDELGPAADEADAAWMAHLRRLQRDFEPKVDLSTLGKVRVDAQRLVFAKSLAALIERYRNHDRRLEIVERAVDRAAIGWDQFVQQQIDTARGK